MEILSRAIDSVPKTEILPALPVPEVNADI